LTIICLALNIFGIMHLMLVDPNTPYFKWGMGNSLSKKIEGLLIKPREKKFKEQLLELR